MKVFVAVRLGTEELFETVEGELVRPARSRHPTGTAGRAFTGIGSGGSCQYARVADLAHLGRTPFRSVFFDALVRDNGIEATNENQRWAMEWAERILVAADALEEGTIVEYDGSRIREAAAR